VKIASWRIRDDVGLLLLFGISLPIKLAAAQNMPWDIDIVPVLSRSFVWLQGGDFPAYGTLSSVAAYNLPMLVWLHLPALFVTRHAESAILLTMLSFNLISTIAIYCAGKSMFGSRSGLIAAVLFTVSEVGISSSYTAWAQLLLPGFYALTLLFLWQWCQYNKGYYLALAGIVATAAFMTHFSAILLYPAMLIFALLARARWHGRWLIIGAAAVLLMFAPYLAFQIERKFVDVRAFVTQERLVSPEVMAQYEALKAESQAQRTAAQADNQVEDTAAAVPQALGQGTAPSRLQRAFNYALSVPGFLWQGSNRVFQMNFAGLSQMSPVLVAIGRGLYAALRLIFWLSAIGVIWQLVQHLRTPGIKRASWQQFSETLISTEAGRACLLLLFGFSILCGFVLTRAVADPSYLMGLFSVQYLLLASALRRIGRLHKAGLIAVLIVLIAYAAVNTTDRAARLLQHDDSAYSRFNVSIYRHVAAATDFIAADWSGENQITVAYDIMPQMRNLWWVPAWNHIDDSYRMGMNFDFLLALHHGLHNDNTDPIGLVADADYWVVYEPGLDRIDWADYEVAQFGSIYVLK